MPVTVGPSTLTINHDRQFLISQPNATMAPQDDVGFYARDTRFVSGYGVTINGRLPLLLDAITVEHFSARYEFMTPELHLGGASGAGADGTLPERSVGFRLERTILEGVHEDYDLTNYATYPVRILLEIAIESDFADIFDVRNHRLIRRGDLQTTWRPRVGELRSTYRNRSFRRALLVKVEKAGSKAEYANGRLVFLCELLPRAEWHVCLKWLPVIGPRPARTLPCHALTGEARVLHPLAPVELVTSHPTLPAIWRQAVEDTEALRMVDTTVRGGTFVPAAGIPWFVTLFGRDSLVVSMESISAFPEFALGALRTLSKVQATDDDAEQDKEPGKIPHEIRSGELASLKLLPFAPYYGTADATPLFIIVLSYAYQWSGDVALLQRYRRNAEAALNWMLQYGDRDGDGFQEYSRRSSQGIFNQGWKDSWDAIRHADGSIPEAPIALCELQGYAFDALLRMAEIYDLLKEPDKAADLRERARRLYQQFNEVFWWEAEGTYYLGLDKEKRPMETVASNAGHCLASGIVPPERAGRVVDRLMADDMWSGWGIRTLSSDHPSFNPYNYQTGAVWPHDNSLIVLGMRRYGFDAEAAALARDISGAASHFLLNQLPELYAGLQRDPTGFPVQYLGANVPQAWAAGTPFVLLQAMLGLQQDAPRGKLYVDPALPAWLPDVKLNDLRLGRRRFDVRFWRDGKETLFEVLKGKRSAVERKAVSALHK